MSSISNIQPTSVNAIITEKGDFDDQLNLKKIIPISNYFLILGGVIGVVVAIAAIVFNQIPIIVTGILLAVFSGVGAIEIRRLAYVKEMNDVNNEINHSNIDFFQHNRILKNQIEELKVERQKFKILEEDYKRIIADNEVRILEETKKVKELITQINFSENELKGLPPVFDSLKEAMISFQNTSVAFINDNKLKQASMDKLFTKIDLLKLDDSDLDKEGKLLNAQITNLKSTIQDASRIIPTFEKIVTIMQHNFIDVNSENKLLKTQIDEFKATVEQLSSIIEGMKKNEGNSQIISNSLQKLYDPKTLIQKLDEEIALLKNQQNKQTLLMPTPLKKDLIKKRSIVAKNH